MYVYSVVCAYTGEVLFESPFLYLCNKFIHDNSLLGCAFVYNTLNTTLETVEYFSGYFDLQMIAIRIQCMSK